MAFSDAFVFIVYLYYLLSAMMSRLDLRVGFL